jgi:D-3-phosphoglycerate dehydrogenase
MPIFLASRKTEMKIAILDDVTMTVAQVNRLRQHGEVEIFTGVPTCPEEILLRARGAHILIASWTKISAKILKSLPLAQMISIWATGYDNVDVKAATRLGIRVAHVPGYATEAVAELTLGLMLAVVRKIPMADGDVRREKQLNWSRFRGRELRGKVLGLLGTGAIGARVAEIAYAFGMNLIAYDLIPQKNLIETFGLQYLPLREVLMRSDILSLHLPLTPDTKRFLSVQEFGQMKRGALFINTARQAIVDQDALLGALESGQIAAAGLDDIDLSQESGRCLLELKQVVFTPHIGFHTTEAITQKTDICFENVIQFIAGNPVNIVNPGTPSRSQTRSS